MKTIDRAAVRRGTVKAVRAAVQGNGSHCSHDSLRMFRNNVPWMHLFVVRRHIVMFCSRHAAGGGGSHYGMMGIVTVPWVSHAHRTPSPAALTTDVRPWRYAVTAYNRGSPAAPCGESVTCATSLLLIRRP